MNKKKNNMGFESMMKPKKNIMFSQDNKTYDTKGNASGSVTHVKRNTGRNSK